MSYAEFAEWAAYYKIEPFGGLRDDLHAALVVAMIANVNRDPKKRKKPYSPADFMPDWWRNKQDPEQAHAAAMMAKFAMLAGSELPEETNGNDRRDVRQADL